MHVGWRGCAHSHSPHEESLCAGKFQGFQFVARPRSGVCVCV